MLYNVIRGRGRVKIEDCHFKILLWGIIWPIPLSFGPIPLPRTSMLLSLCVPIMRIVTLFNISANFIVTC